LPIRLPLLGKQLRNVVFSMIYGTGFGKFLYRFFGLNGCAGKHPATKAAFWKFIYPGILGDSWWFFADSGILRNK